MKKISQKNKLIYTMIFIIAIISLLYFSSNILQKKALYHIITNTVLEMYIDEDGIWLYPIEDNFYSNRNIRYKTISDKKYMKYEDALIVSENNNKIIYTVSKLDEVNKAEILKQDEVSLITDFHKDVINNNRTIYAYQIDKNFFYDQYWKHMTGRIIDFNILPF